MVLKDKDFLNSIKENKEFHDALIKCFPNGIPEDIKETVNKGYISIYDAGVVCDDLHGCTEYPD